MDPVFRVPDGPRFISIKTFQAASTAAASRGKGKNDNEAMHHCDVRVTTHMCTAHTHTGEGSLTHTHTHTRTLSINCGANLKTEGRFH